MKHQQERELICDLCYQMWSLGWVASNDGNVSLRLEDGNILVTPTGISKRLVTPESLVLTDKNGNIIEAEEGFKPSSEFKMHLRCYSDRADVNGVVHAHPPYATAFAVANKPLDEYSMIETVIGMGSVPVTPYATPSTDEVPNAIAPYLDKHDALLLAHHGALTVGTSLLSAFYKMESLEHFAKITINAHILGGAKELSRENIDTLISMRDKYKCTGRHPGYKKYSKE